MAATAMSKADRKIVSEVISELYFLFGDPDFTPDEKELFKKLADELNDDLKILVRARFNQSTKKFKKSKTALNSAFKKLKGELAALKKASEIAKTFGAAAKALDGLLKVAAGVGGRALPG